MSDFDRTRAVRARKPHRCHECLRTIGPGETYWRTAGVWEGDFFTFVSCDHCHEARDRVTDRSPFDWTYGGQRWADEWADAAEDERDPVWRAHLWRLVAGHRRQWRRRDGALMVIPPAPGGAA